MKRIVLSETTKVSLAEYYKKKMSLGEQRKIEVEFTEEEYDMISSAAEMSHITVCDFILVALIEELNKGER